MSTETTEKKVYPSQLNSKTISARVPVQDYVDFLQDSLTKGISLNDWLLMKIYNSNSKIGNNDIGVIELETKDCEEMGFAFDYVLKFYKDEFVDGIWTINKENLLELLGYFYNNTTQLQNYIDRADRKEASLADVKLQLSILISNKFKDSKDRKEFKNDLFELLNELQ
jgi:hypothetical protein